MRTQTASDTSLRFAITNKRLIRFLYTSKLRIAEPHDYGTKGGVPKLLVYQVGGQSTTVVRGWKLLDVDKIQDLVVLERGFRGTRVKPDQHHMHWDEVFVRVDG
jgi:hypothetical protein